MTSPSPALLDGLVQTSFTVLAKLTQVAAAHDLSLTQLRMLGILRDREPKMAELADHLGLDRSSVSGLVDRAVARGLVRRTASPEDGRAVHVSLTAAARRLAVVITAEANELMAPLTSALTAADQQRLSGLLDRLLA